MKIEDILKIKKGTIIDVRTPAEFSGGHVAGSINIPLNRLPDNFKKLTAMEFPLVLCCASGIRSAQAAEFLNSRGLDCINAGS